SCGLAPAPLPARAALPLRAPRSHRPRPARQEKRAAPALPPWPGRRPGLGACAQSPLLPVLAPPTPSPARSFLVPPRAGTPARLGGSERPPPALGPGAIPDGVDARQPP